jgi:ubiquinone/menaquinone biosynthesis C-methylase UbiE
VTSGPADDTRRTALKIEWKPAQRTPAERYDSWYESPLGRFCFAAETALLLRGMGEISGQSILELGCGTGRFLSAVATHAAIAVGVDQDRAMLEVAQRRTIRNTSRFTWMQAEAASVPLPDASFDVVFESTLLCFQRDARPVLEEMIRVCRPGGRIVLGELNPRSPWQLWRRAKARLGIGYFRHAHWHTPRQMMRLWNKLDAQPGLWGGQSSRYQSIGQTWQCCATQPRR